MDARIIEQVASCPYCAETISVVLDLSAGTQSYIEDCHVCCQPLQITLVSERDALVSLQVERA